MTMDPATQAIARFIGLFELSTEELRLRQDYLEFRLKRAQEDEAPPPEPVGVRIQAPYQIGQFDPRLDYDPVAPDLLPVEWTAESARLEIDVPAPPAPEALPDDAPDTFVMQLIIELQPPPFGFLLDPPGSIVSVTIQTATLSDDDLFLSGLGTTFVDPTELKAELDAIASMAETLVGFDMPGMPVDGDWTSFAEDMLAQLDAAEAAGGQVSATALRGEDAQGIVVDGVAVDEAPVWTDLLPKYLRPEEPADAATADSHATEGDEGGNGASAWVTEHDFSRDFKDDAPLAGGLDPGVEIVAGANKAINEVAVSSNWLDAPVIVVRGDVAKLDAISQVNVLVEHDRIDGAPAGQASFATNIAEITEVSSEDGGEPPPPFDVLPQGWQVVRIEADLLQVNWVKQFTFVTDFDRAEIIVSGSSTFLGLGENQIVNSTILNEFGYNFDLIFVGGDMIDATIVSQKNVLFDSDTVIAGGAVAQTAPAPQTVAAGAPTHVDAASETAAQDPAPPEELGAGPAVSSPDANGDGAEAAMALSSQNRLPHHTELEREATPQQAPERASDQSIAAESPSPENGEPGPPEADAGADAIEPDAPESDAAPPLSLADNLLLNQATIKTTGIDTFVEMTEKFAATAQKLAEGAETISREIAQDAMFAGKQALKVLQIDGDLAKVNLFEQTNIIGDADQIRLEMLALRDQLATEMNLIAGSNALVNLATAIEHGMDSKVMAGGHVYDDAFIHQAELFDTNSAPNGVALSALANEAVAAFLSEDMTKLPAPEDGIAPQGNYEAPSQVDVMQTLLA